MTTSASHLPVERQVSTRCFHLAQALRHRGHLAARLDPLRGKQSRAAAEPWGTAVGGEEPLGKIGEQRGKIGETLVNIGKSREDLGKNMRFVGSNGI